MSSRHNTVAAPVILPVCCVCNQVADDDAQSPGAWTALQTYLDGHHLTQADFQLSHTYCPSCYSTQAQAWHLPQTAPPLRRRARRLRSRP